MRAILLFAAATLLTSGCTVEVPDGDSGWPQRVLLTNDNGIDDVALIELARTNAKVTRARSGSRRRLDED